jgi:hypothetical protein
MGACYHGLPIVGYEVTEPDGSSRIWPSEAQAMAHRSRLSVVTVLRAGDSLGEA